MQQNRPWSFFRPQPLVSRPIPNHISPDTAQIIRALQSGQRSQIKPMPPPQLSRRR